MDVVDAGDFLKLLIRSVGCSSTSRAEAPGHSANHHDLEGEGRIPGPTKVLQEITIRPATIR